MNRWCPNRARLDVAGQVVHVQMHIAGQQVAGAERDQAHRGVRAGEDLSHHAHGTVAAAGEDDVGPVVQRRPRLREAGVLRGGFKERGASPAGRRAGPLNERRGPRPTWP